MKKILCLLLIFCINLLLTVSAEIVAFNTHTKIFHSLSCRYASICKKCIKIEKQEAIKQGGRACKVCKDRIKN